MAHLKDQDILFGCISGDRQAQEAFVRQFSDLVYRTLQYVFKTRNIPYSQLDLEDLHNTVFLNFFEQGCKKLRQYEGKNGCSLGTWIRIVAVRIVLNHLRKKGVDALTWEKKRTALDEMPELKGDGADPLAAMDREERDRILQDGVRSLPPRDRLFMKLHIDQGLPVEDVASTLGISVQNAYTVKHRAIKRLKAYVVSVTE